MSEVLSYEGFKNSNSFNKISNVLLEEVHHQLFANGLLDTHEKYILGHHIRNVWDTDCPFVSIKTHEESDEIARAIRKRNKKSGLHTFNHVIDSLYYPDLYVEGSDEAGKIIVANLDFRNTLKNGFFHPSDQEFEIGSVPHIFQDFDTKALYFVGSKTVVDEVEGISPVAGIDYLYSRCIYGIQQICDELEIGLSTISAYKAIAASIYQMLTYRNYGKNMVSVIIRPGDPLKSVLGISLFVEREVNNELVDFILQTLCLQTNYLNDLNESELQREFSDQKSLYYKHQNVDDNIRLSTLIEERRKIPKFLYLDAKPESPEYKIAESLVSKSGLDEKLISSLNSFFLLGKQFLYRKNEGKGVSYGLLLGNPFLITYWSHSNPIPCSQKSLATDNPADNIFFKIEDLPEQIHLCSGPSDRALVIPYFNGSFNNNSSLPSYILELNRHYESFISSEDSDLWIPDYLPYTYFTRRYPWSFGCVVGPGPEIRLFSQGGIAAFRDGRGWKSVVKPKAFEDRLNKIPDLLLNGIMKAALQLSPFVRPSSKGSFLIYIPESDQTKPELEVKKWDWIQKDVFNSLFDNEPMRLDHLTNWLTKKTIVDDDGRLNYDTLSLINQAGHLDGAIVLGGNRGEVKSISQKLNLSKDIGDQDRLFADSKYKVRTGSKRAAAQLFVRFANSSQKRIRLQQDLELSVNEILEDSFAVTISSDGPIIVHFWESGNYETIEIFQAV